MSEKNFGAVGDDAQSNQNIKAERSPTTPPIAPSTGRPRFVVTFSPGPGVDAVRSLRWLLKIAKRRLGLTAVDAYEDRTSPLKISNQVADEFRQLRDEVVAESAQAWKPR